MKNDIKAPSSIQHDFSRVVVRQSNVLRVADLALMVAGMLLLFWIVVFVWPDRQARHDCLSMQSFNNYPTSSEKSACAQAGIDITQ